MSKLYTEDQLRELGKYVRGKNVGELIASLTPIELPTDKEIEKVAEKTLSVNFLSFIEGAKWMRDEIKGGSDE